MALSLQIPKQIKTKRLFLKAYGLNDSEKLLKIIERNRNHLRGIMPDFVLNISSIEDANAFLHQLASDWQARKRFCFGVWERISEKFVAEIFIQAMDWDVPTFELGFYADVNNQGKGFVTESVEAAVNMIFKDLKAHKICIVCDNSEPRSHAVAERCGFVFEGVLREQKRRLGGGFISSRFYGLLLNEYKERRKT